MQEGVVHHDKDSSRRLGFEVQLPQIRHHLVSFAKVNQTLVDLSQVVAKVLTEYFCQNACIGGRGAFRCFCILQIHELRERNRKGSFLPVYI